MGENAWLSLRSCKKHRRGRSEDDIDRLSELPDEVVLSILSCLTMKEAAVTSVLSRKWNQLWGYYPGIFNFQDPRTYKQQQIDDNTPGNEYTSNFVRQITRVVEQHVGPSLEEFKVSFELDNEYQSHVDKWVVFALAKGVKTLVLHFNIVTKGNCTLPHESFGLLKTMSCLKTLVLININVTTEALECFLHSCPLLETLRISHSIGLVSIRASCSPLALRHFDVSRCSEMEKIDILAPKLLTFVYQGPSIQLHIRKASLLSEVSIGGDRDYPIAYAFDSLSEYFPRLEYLNLTASVLSVGDRVTIYPVSVMNSFLPPVSNLTNLKHLRLSIRTEFFHSLLGWISLIQASPLLEKLTLELSYMTIGFPQRLGKHSSPRPLSHLKTLELYGFVGRRVDLELATYVLENARVLEEVIIGFKVYSRRRPSGSALHERMERIKERMERIKELTEKFPAGVKLVLIE